MAKKKKVEFPKRAIIRNIPIYGGSLIMTTEPECLEKVLLALEVPRHQWPTDRNMESAGFTATYDSEEYGHIITIHLNDLQPRTLVHELAHAAFDVLDWAGVETGSGPREAYCYLYDYLFNEFYREVGRRWQKIEDKLNAKRANK